MPGSVLSTLLISKFWRTAFILVVTLLISWALFADIDGRGRAIASAIFCGVPEGFEASIKNHSQPILYTVSGKLYYSESLAKAELWTTKNDVLIAELPLVPADDQGILVSWCGENRGYRFVIRVPVSAIPFNETQLTVKGITSTGSSLLGKIPIPHRIPIGFIENSKPLSRTDSTIHGWALSATGSVALQLGVGGRIIAEAATGGARPDVAMVYKLWPGAESAGFYLPVPFSELGPGTHQTWVRMTDQNGASRRLKGPMIENNQSFALIESKDKPVRLGAKNIVSGWAVTKTGEGKVRIKALGKEIATVPVAGIRSDVKNVYRFWRYAEQSGFQWLVPFRELPRGRYSLTLEFIEDKETFLVSEGPQVENDFPVGRVLSDAWQITNPERLEFDVWVADEDGIANVELTTRNGRASVLMDLIEPSISYAEVRSPDEMLLGEPVTTIRSGALYRGVLDTDVFANGLERVVVKVTDNTGRQSELPGPLVLPSVGSDNLSCAGEPLRLYFPGDTRFWRKGAPELHQLRRIVEGACVKVGMQSRVEYLRTTKGEGQDYQFDPDFPDHRRITPKGTMLSTALNELIGYAEMWDMPLMVTLDGGVWADSAFSAPDLDVVDKLEQDEINVQWNQFGRSERDDALSDLPGSFGSPELARMMSLNWYNHLFHSYKKRNLKSAVRAIQDSTLVKSGGQVSVNLDPDQYINPWFYKTQWYDYNPNTLRQFREWLLHQGPYADNGPLVGRGVRVGMTLGDINAVAGQNWTKREQIDPPREVLDYQSPWHQLWTQFKRHLVDLHYDQLSVWAAEAGMPADNIYSSQTFIQTDVAETLFDQASGWPDEAGVSIEGAKPDRGHLGAILYGAASRDEGVSRSGGSMFQSIRRVDPQWGVVELNPATIAFPGWVAGHTLSYQTMGNILNAGARFITPMWGSHLGDLMTYPATFRSYDAFIGTPFEFQLVWWLRERRNIPAGALHYPFGNSEVLSDDGWRPAHGTEIERQYGEIQLRGEGDIVLLSPDRLGLSAGQGVQLTLQGRWCESSGLSAELSFSDNSVQTVVLQPDGNKSLARITGRKGLALTGILLRWGQRQCETLQDVMLKSVSIVPLAGF